MSHPSFMHPTANGVMRAWVLTMAMGDEDDGFDVHDDDGRVDFAVMYQLFFPPHLSLFEYTPLIVSALFPLFCVQVKDWCGLVR